MNRWFLANGSEVIFPISEPRHHDLVVAAGERRLHRVDVKATTQVNSRRRYVVMIVTTGGDQSWGGLVRASDPAQLICSTC